MMDRLKKYSKQLAIVLLAVEDDRDMIELLQRVFHEHGFENPRFFTDPEEALKVIAEEGPSICILDYYLTPHLNGLQVLLAAKEKNKDCYFIAFTGLQDIKLLRPWINAGVNKWVDKNDRNSMNELAGYIHEAIDMIKQDFELHQNLLRKIEKYEAKIAL